MKWIQMKIKQWKNNHSNQTYRGNNSDFFKIGSLVQLLGCICLENEQAKPNLQVFQHGSGNIKSWLIYIKV